MLSKPARHQPLASAAACATLFLQAFASDQNVEAAPAGQHAKTAPKAQRSQSKVEEEPNYVKPTMEYDEILDPSKKRTISTMLSAEFAIRARRSDRAIELARRAMKRDPDDIEIHLALAEALDLKLEEQTEKDPRIFEECIKEYLIVMRNGVGMEKGTNFKGIGILDHMFGDEDHHFLAKARLKFLTGFAPKPWETNEKYLKKVLHPAQTDVKGRILKHSD